MFKCSHTLRTLAHKNIHLQGKTVAVKGKELYAAAKAGEIRTLLLLLDAKADVHYTDLNVSAYHACVLETWKGGKYHIQTQFLFL